MRYNQYELLCPFSTILGPPSIRAGFTQADKVKVVSLRLGVSSTKMWLDPSKLPTCIVSSQGKRTPDATPWFFLPLLSAAVPSREYHATKPSHFGESRVRYLIFCSGVSRKPYRFRTRSTVEASVTPSPSVGSVKSLSKVSTGGSRFPATILR